MWGLSVLYIQFFYKTKTTLKEKKKTSCSCYQASVFFTISQIFLPTDLCYTEVERDFQHGGELLEKCQRAYGERLTQKMFAVLSCEEAISVSRLVPMEVRLLPSHRALGDRKQLHNHISKRWLPSSRERCSQVAKLARDF